MATKKQSKANRRNGKKSTGPRTDTGKARSAQNAVTHGLTVRACVLPDEDTAEHAAFVDGVRADLAPMGMLEEAFAVQVADGMWRLLRIPRLEAACLAHELAQAGDHAARLREIPGLPSSAAQGEEHALGTAFLKLNAGGLPNSLARYEAAIQRGVERSLKLLQDPQRQRMTAEHAALRNRADFPVAQTRQGFPGEERSRSRRAGQADNSGAGVSPRASDGQRGSRPAPGSDAGLDSRRAGPRTGRRARRWTTRRAASQSGWRTGRRADWWAPPWTDRRAACRAGRSQA